MGGGQTADFRRAERRERGGMTYKSRLAGIDEGFGCEPFPHECARRSIVDGVDQPVNVIVD